MGETRSNLQNQQVVIKNLELQFEQLANAMIDMEIEYFPEGESTITTVGEEICAIKNMEKNCLSESM